MNQKENAEKKHLNNLFRNIGCIGFISIPFFGFAALFFSIELLRKLVCEILRIRCIDADSGEYIELPWKVVIIMIGIGSVFIIIDKIVAWWKQQSKT